MDCPGNGIIFGTAMAEKRLENGKVRYSAACPTGAERCKILPWGSVVLYTDRTTNASLLLELTQ